MIFLEDRQGSFPGFRHAEYEIDADRLLRFHPERTPDRNDWVENRTCSTGKRRGILHGCRADRGATSADKTCSVRFIGDFTPCTFSTHHRMEKPWSHFAF